MSDLKAPADTPIEAGAETPIKRLMAAQKRYTREFVAELVQVRGLMPLLMKRRNGGRWTPEEKAELLRQLRLLSRLSPILLILLLPGSALLLPIYAWWLERRRKQRGGASATPSKHPASVIVASPPATSPGSPPDLPDSGATPGQF